MNLGEFRELTKNFDSSLEINISLDCEYEGDKILREEIEAEVYSVEMDEDGRNRKFLWILGK